MILLQDTMIVHVTRATRLAPVLGQHCPANSRRSACPMPREGRPLELCVLQCFPTCMKKHSCWQGSPETSK